jgi:hypothetical protein
MRLSTTTRLCLLPLAFVIGACTVILPPDDSDDGVERCENSSECAEPADNRLVAVCYVDEGLTDGAPGVCINEYKQPSCEPTGTEPWATAAQNAAGSGAAAYAGCSDENAGKQGCKARAAGHPDGAGCDSGLEEQEFEGLSGIFCVDPDATMSTLPASVDRAGQDVQHAYCRAFFGCDTAFVCDFSDSKCRPCDPTAGADDGGCVEMWIEGAVATSYDIPDSSCNNGSNDVSTIEVGPVNTAP